MTATYPIRQSVYAITLMATALAPVVAHAQKLPTADQIFENYVSATGGRAAYQKITSTLTTGTIELPAAKIKGTLTVKAKAPNKFLMITDITGIGTTTVCYDGKIGWSKDPINGFRTLSGKELAQIKDNANFNSTISWKQNYTKAEVLGIRKVNGIPAYAVRVTPKEGPASVQYFDQKSKLLVRTDMVAESANGSLPTENYTSDYRAQDGIKIPYLMRQIVASQEVVMKTTSVKNNVKIDDADFAKPEEKH